MIKLLRSNFAQIVVFITYGLLTSFWFITNQIWSLCQDYPECSYPFPILFLTFLKSFFVSILCYTTWHKFINFCIKEKIESRLLLAIFSPIILLLFEVKILVTLELILVFSAILIFSKKKLRFNSDHLIDVIYFLFLLCALLFFCEPFSPLYFEYSTADLRGDLYRLPFFSEFFKSAIWAKHFSFSGIDYTNWAAVIHSPMPSSSLLFQALVLLLDLPSLDLISFYKILLSVIFTLFLVGSFSFYLLTYYGLKFNRGLAFFAGISFIFGNHRFLISSRSLEGDGYIFLASYALLPLALFLFTLSLSKKSYIYAVLSGIALALAPLILPTHPEAIIYSAAIYFTVTFFAALLHDDESLGLQKKLFFFTTSLFAFLAFLTIYFLPIFFDITDGNMAVYGHKDSRLYNLYPTIKDYIPFLLIGTMTVFYLLIFKRRYNGFICGSIITIGLFAAFLFAQPSDLIHQIVFYFVSLHTASYFRPLMFLVPLVIIVGLYSINLATQWMLNLLSFSSQSRVVRIFATFAINSAIALLLFTDDLFPIQSFTLDKSNNCPYYITLQSNLSNYHGLQGDRANLPFIKNKLEKFESDISKNSNSYLNRYREILKNNNISTAKDLPEDKIIGFSDDTYKLVDNFYLDENLNCVNILLDHAIPLEKTHWEKSLWYNIDGIYYGLNKNFQRIMTTFFGIGNGYLIHNVTAAADSRFVISYPTIHSLYLTPNYYQNNQTEFRHYYHSDYPNIAIANQKNMKFFDVSGIDIITTAKSYKNNSDLIPITFSHHKIFGYEKDFAIFKNSNSYSATYIAGRTHLVEKDLVKNSNKKIKDYFDQKISFNDYVKTIKKLQEPITTLTKKYDVAIEDPALFKRYQDNKRSAADIAEVKSIAGNKIFIKANCAEAKCLLGLNLTAFPYWKAFVNKDRTEIYRINLAFMGIEIPHGESGILFICENYLTNDLLFLTIVILLIFLVQYNHFAQITLRNKIN